MLAATEIASSTAIEPNSLPAIKQRVASGAVSWAGPLILVVGRSFLWMASQGLVAMIFLAQRHAKPWREATCWWTVCFTLADIGCLAGMYYFTRREGIRLRDLLGPVRMRHGRDLLLGVGYFLLAFPFFLGGGYLAQMLFFGPSGLNPSTYIFHAHALPLWATVYTVGVWWVIQSATEEATYQAYALPRLEALTGRRWLAVAVVAFWWTAQHCAIGFVPDWRSLLCRFLGFLPGVLVMMGIYLRTRRLMPLIFAHWPMDIAAALMTAF